MRYRISGVPGAGKTTWIVNKVNELLEQGVSPNEIFCISFSKAAVEELQRRLNNNIKYVKTVHSICMYASRKNPYNKAPFTYKYDMKDCIVNFNPYDLEQYIENKEKVSLPEVYDCVRIYNYEIYNKWLYVKDYEKIIKDIKGSSNRRMLLRYLNNHKIKNKICDFIDTVIYTYNLDITLNDLYNKKFKYVFIDEAQDFTELEHKVVNQLVRNIDNIYFIGDEDQSIYAFKGSNCDLFLNDSYDNVTYLDTSYRCPMNILDMASKIRNKILSKDKTKNIKSINDGGEINVECFEKDEIVPYLIKTRDNVMDSMYVLYRFNKDVYSAIIDFMLLGYRPKIIKSSNKFIKTVEHILSIYDKTSKYENLTKQEWAISYKYVDTSKVRGKNKFDMINRKMYTEIVENSNFTESKIRKLLRMKFYKKLTDIDIHIDTMHASKGTEAHNVYIVETWDDSHLLRMINDKSEMDNELKLMYVAVTRSKNYLEFIIPKGYQDIIHLIVNSKDKNDLYNKYKINKDLELI